LFAYIAGTTLPRAVCSSSEDHVTLNHADVIQGTSQLDFTVIVDDRPLDVDVTPALLGSNTYLVLPPGGSEETPIRLLIKRSSQSSSWQFKLFSVNLNVVYARRVDIVVYDFDGEVAAERTVR